MYFLKAPDEQRPFALIFWSGTPLEKAVVATPILKLRPLYRLQSKLHQLNDRHNWSVKYFRDTGDPSMKVKKGPEVGFLT